jgi:hypothetical protein
MAFRVCAVLSIMLTACIERDRTNIYDPKTSVDSLDAGLYLSTADTIVTLNWRYPNTADVQGVNIYRRRSDELSYRQIASVSNDHSSYADAIEVSDIPYLYYITYSGQESESRPSFSISVTPGPGSIWLLDKGDEYLRRLSYDLQHTLSRRYMVWYPECLAVDPNWKYGLITYPAWRYAEIFRISDNQLLSEATGLRRPYEAVYNPVTHDFWITDSSAGLFRQEMNSTTVQSVESSLLRPTQIRSDIKGNVYVLDKTRKAIYLFDHDGVQQKVIGAQPGLFLRDPLFFDLSLSQNELLIIDQGCEPRCLYRYFLHGDSSSMILQESDLQLVRDDSFQPQRLWIVRNNGDVSKILQLSYQGERLISFEGFKDLTDLRINPYNGSLVVSDALERTVTHFDRSNKRIGVYKEGYYPYRVLIE